MKEKIKKIKLDMSNKKNKIFENTDIGDIRFALLLAFFFGISSVVLFNSFLGIFDKDITMRNFDKCHDEFYTGEIKNLDILRDCVRYEKSK